MSEVAGEFSILHKKTPSIKYLGLIYGGERGIRTLDTLLTYTPLAGARLQPLGQLSKFYLIKRREPPLYFNLS
jgi:hypothetical protein